MHTQVLLQASLALDADLGACTTEQCAVLLGSRSLPPDVRTWDGPVPLVLVTSFYRPLGRLPTPSGRLVWLDPSSDEALLSSLLEVGAAVLSERRG